MAEIIPFENNNQLVVDSRIIAEELGIEHESLMRNLDKNKEVAEQAFGIFRFEIGKIEGRGRPQKYALLTEDQSTFLMTLSENTPKVIQCKVKLVKAFAQAKELLRKNKHKRFEITPENFVLNEALPWKSDTDGPKPFITEFYEHLYRIRGGEWAKRDFRVSQRPACVGIWTNKFIYDLFPGSIPKALREKYKNQSGGNKKYEFLTQEIGRSYLGLHMAALLAIMRVSPSNNWSRFLSNIQKGIPDGSIQAIQMELDFLVEVEEDCAREIDNNQ